MRTHIIEDQTGFIDQVLSILKSIPELELTSSRRLPDEAELIVCSDKFYRENVEKFLMEEQGFVLVLCQNTQELEKLTDRSATQILNLSHPRWEVESQLRGLFDLMCQVCSLKKKAEGLEEISLLLRHLNREWETVSLVDSLTQLPNRRQLDEYLSREIKRAARSENPISVLLIDIDHFKSYNDQFGHIEGDECLRRVGQTLKDCARRPADLIARYGGEEFAAILPQTDLAGAKVVAEALRKSIEKLEIENPSKAQPKRKLSISIGGCAFESARSSGEVALERADECLYRAKSLGRNRCFVEAFEKALKEPFKTKTPAENFKKRT